MAAIKARAAKRPRKKASPDGAGAPVVAKKKAKNQAKAKSTRKPAAKKAKKAKRSKTSQPPDGSSEPPASRFRVSRASSLPPRPWVSRCKDASWPPEPWLPANTDVAFAQELMLHAYWFADQLESSELSEARRASFRAAIKRASSMLANDVPELTTWVVATAVRCHGALMVEAHEAEKRRIRPGGVLDALLDGHTEQAVHDTLEQVQAHNPKAAAWLRELERRGRSELRTALAACGKTPWQPDDPEHREALRRLLALVLFATERVNP